MATIQEIQADIIDEFSMFDDWMQRYEYIILNLLLIVML